MSNYTSGKMYMNLLKAWLYPQGKMGGNENSS